MTKQPPRRATQKILFDAENGIADLHEKEWFPDLADINARIAAKYDFPDHQSHFDYLAEATFLIQAYSGIHIDGHVVTVPSDLTPFKGAKAKFQKALQRADELSEAIFDIRSDATADTLLHAFDPQRETMALMKMLGRATFILSEIEKYEGRVGNRMVPDWIERFCVHSQQFWQKEQGGGTRIIFEQARQTKITPWIKDVYLNLTKHLNIDVPLSRLKGVARHVPAYRSEADANNGDT